ncbi:MAG TPA: hypothetical protein VMQ73_18175 [Methylomirabilota bacterium]|nr:hypothetical protein [Methylomirabilota bacterium]
MIRLTENDWAFVPGPSEIPDAPQSSIDLQDVANYPADAIAQAFLGYPGFRLMHAADPTWWQWRAEWECDRGFLLVDMTLFETDPVAWGGSGISGFCELDDLLALWRDLREKFPAIWLHNGDCEIHTPESFARFVNSQRTH